MNRVALVGLLLWVAGCARSEETVQVPDKTPPKVVAPPVKTAPDTAAPSRVVPPKTKVTHLRLMLPAPSSIESLNAHGLRPLRAMVRAGKRVLADDIAVKSLRSVGEGHAILVVVAGRVPWSILDAASGLTAKLAGADRIGVGAIGPDGFSLVYNFSVDARAAQTAIVHAGTTAPPDGEPGRPIAFLRSLRDAVDAFKGRHSLPKLRRLIVVGDGMDHTLRRSSQRHHAMTEVRRWAAYRGVRITGLGFGDNDKALQDLSELATGSGGHYIHLATSNPKREVALGAWQATSAALDRWLVVDVVALDAPIGDTRLSIAVTTPQTPVEASAAVRLPRPSNSRITYDMSIPPMPDRVLPVGVKNVLETEKRAVAAEKAKDWLRAGALWHLVDQAQPDHKEAALKAKKADLAHRAAGSVLGHVIVGGEPVPVDVPVAREFKRLRTVWKSLDSDGTLEDILRARIPPPAENVPGSGGDHFVHQLVLHRCQTSDPDVCMARLLVERTATHLFIDPAGRVTQLMDLDTIVMNPDVALRETDGEALHLHLAMPPDSALAWVDPSDQATWRLPRHHVEDVAVNTARVSGWDLTEAQYASLIPLVRALDIYYADLAPTLPQAKNGRGIRHALADVSAFNGVLLATNLSRDVTASPGPGLRMEYLNRAMPAWWWQTSSTDMEDWLTLLTDERRQPATISRFVALGHLAVPMLEEVALELPAVEARAALEALWRIGEPAAAKTVAKALAAVPREPSESQARVLDEAILALAALGAPEQIPALSAVLSRLTAVDGHAVDEQRARRRLVVGAITAIAKEPEHLESLEALATSEDSVIRAQIAATWLRIGGDAAAPRFKRLQSDAEPWLRAVAAARLGDSEAVAAEREALGTRETCRLLAQTPSIPLAVAEWLTDTSGANQYVVSRLLIDKKVAGAVKPLARKLSKASASDKRVMLRTLRGITGRDYGSTPDGWLTWEPPP